MQCRTDNSNRAQPRAGFTLIEILVVIVIIAILMGLVFAVYADSLENARVQSTRATIAQLDAHLLDRQEAFQSLNLDSQTRQFIRLYNASGNPAPVDRLDSITHFQLAELLVRKDRFRAAFPQRFEDLCGFDGQPGLAGTDDDSDGDTDTDGSPARVDISELGLGGAFGGDAPLGSVLRRKLAAGEFNPNLHNPDTESSELLYLTLTEGGSFGLPSLGLDEINANHLQDTDGDGLLEVIDEWGNPLRFYNWPTRLIRRDGEYQHIDGTLLQLTGGVVFPNVTSPSGTIPLWLYNNPLNTDPDDPTGILSLWRDGEDLDGSGDLSSLAPPPPAPGEDLDGNGQIDPADGGGTPIRFFQQPFTLGPTTALALDESFYHTLNTYHVPLIVSAGPDELTGLFEPDGRDPRTPTVPPTPVQIPRRLAQPLATSVGDSDLLDWLYDNVSNRRR